MSESFHPAMVLAYLHELTGDAPAAVLDLHGRLLAGSSVVAASAGESRRGLLGGAGADELLEPLGATTLVAARGSGHVLAAFVDAGGLAELVRHDLRAALALLESANAARA